MYEELRELFYNKKQEFCIVSDRIEDEKRFIRQFADLFRLDTLKPGLDTILTALYEGRVKFILKLDEEVNLNPKIILEGYCSTKTITEDHGNILGKFQTKHYEIVIKNLALEVIMHEITHALEFESTVDLSLEFFEIIKHDINNWQKTHIHLSSAIKRILYQDLKYYPRNEINSELLARFIQLISSGKDVHKTAKDYYFSSEEVMSLFKSTSIWLWQKFNPMLLQKTNDRIYRSTETISQWVRKQKQTQDFGIRSLHKDPNKPDQTQNSRPQWSKFIKKKLD